MLAARRLTVTSRAWRVIAVTLVVASSIAVWSTARVFSGTVDEPAHLAAGMQWLTTGQYTYDLQHPPLGRVAAALGPYLHGARTVGEAGIYDEGARLLGQGRHYSDVLASARHGELVFFLLMAAIVWLWARRLLGEAGGAVAVLFVVTNPDLLAHAGLATTDIACAAMTALGLYAAARWIDRPTWAATFSLGVAAGLAACSRLSAIAFLGGALIACYLLHAWATRGWSLGSALDGRRWTERIFAALLVFALVVWAVYRFDVGRFTPDGLRLPAPAFIAGIDRFVLHGGAGHPSFLLGTPGNRGWWYYFPVALAIKTPLPLLLLATLGSAEVVRRLRDRRDWQAAVPLVAAAAMLAVAMTVHVDLGIRLVLPLYPLLAIVAAYGAITLWSQMPQLASRVALAVLVAWSTIGAVRSHPDYLAYFNALAGSHPERILVDSNLDWGQDLYRLRDTVIARGIRDSIRVAYFGTADPSAIGVPNARQLGLHERATGWIAASETYLAGEWVGGAYAWLLDYPAVARIGPSMRLWYIPPDRATAVTTDSSRR